MAFSNSIHLIGNLTADPEVRYTDSGLAIGKLRIAANEKWTDRNGQEKEDTLFQDVTVFGGMAENLRATLTKGMRVVAVGRLTSRSYEDSQGIKRVAYEVIADAVGPDLRYASATVERTSSGANGRASNGAAPAPAPAGGGAPPPPEDDDPF